MSSKKALARRYQALLDKEKDPRRREYYTGKIKKLTEKFSPPTSKPGERIRSPGEGKKEKAPKKYNPIGSTRKKKVAPPESDDWWGEDEATDTDWWKAKPKFGLSPGALGGRFELPQGFKHGGRIKKAKKKTKKRKRAALRGYRAELRGG
jgi:hypothetical protein